MIQRIQSLYLLMAAVLMSLVFFTPLATFYGDGESVRLTARGFEHVLADGPGELLVRTSHMAILVALTALMPLLTIFLFKKRMLQIRLCYAGIVLTAGAQLMIAWYLWQARTVISQFTVNAMAMTMADAMPLASIVFTVMAIRGVIRDEALVRSLDRIR
jgi:hypothetical protein